MRNHIKKRNFARQLRRNQTDAEGKLWKLLRSNQLAGFKFRRQHVIGPYIADYCCLAEKLVIELDGGQHTDAVSYDGDRTRFLEEKGFKVLRFWDNEVLTNPDGAVEAVLLALTPTLSQLKLGEGEKRDAVLKKSPRSPKAGEG